MYGVQGLAEPRVACELRVAPTRRRVIAASAREVGIRRAQLGRAGPRSVVRDRAARVGAGQPVVDRGSRRRKPRYSKKGATVAEAATIDSNWSAVLDGQAAAEPVEELASAGPRRVHGRLGGRWSATAGSGTVRATSVAGATSSAQLSRGSPGDRADHGLLRPEPESREQVGRIGPAQADDDHVGGVDDGLVVGGDADRREALRQLPPSGSRCAARAPPAARAAAPSHRPTTIAAAIEPTPMTPYVGSPVLTRELCHPARRVGLPAVALHVAHRARVGDRVGDVEDVAPAELGCDGIEFAATPRRDHTVAAESSVESSVEPVPPPSSQAIRVAPPKGQLRLQLDVGPGRGVDRAVVPQLAPEQSAAESDGSSSLAQPADARTSTVAATSTDVRRPCIASTFPPGPGSALSRWTRDPSCRRAPGFAASCRSPRR